MSEKVIFRVITFALFIVLSFIIVYKAVNLPLTFDEVVTWERYTSTAGVINIMSGGDGSSNNHILNSLSIKACQFLWGDKPWVLRLPNVMSFFLFAVCAWTIAKKYFALSPLLFWLPLICLLLNPYLVDFFSLARGYGMANAFMAASIVCLLLFSSGKQIRWYYLTILFAMLASYSNFTFLIFWLAVHLLLTGVLLTTGRNIQYVKRSLVISCFIAVAFSLLCYFPLKTMQQCIQSTFGDHTGFYHDTILTETNRFNYGTPLPALSDKVLSLIICVIGVVAGINFIHKIRKGWLSAFTDPFNLVFLLLVLVWSTNMLQVFFFKTSYLSGRTALIYYLLFTFVLIFLVRDLASKNLFLSQITAGVISLLLIWHFTYSVNLKSFYEWSFDAYTYDVMNQVEDYKHLHPETKTIELNLTNFLHPSFSFYAKTNKLPWFKLSNPQNSGADTTSQTLFYYTTADHIKELKNYTVIKKFKPNGILLPVVNASGEQVLLMYK